MNNDALLKNIASYDENAELWDSVMSVHVGHVFLEKPAMEELLPEKLDQMDILCVGVGSGTEIKSLHTRNPRKIAGVDVSEKLLEIAKRKHPTVEMVKSDMHRLPFDDASFDFIYSSLTFHYSCDWDTLLKEMNRVLKSGGTLLFSTHNPPRWGQKPATGNTYTNSNGVTVREHRVTLPSGVEIIYCNHKDQQSILDSVTRSGFEIIRYLTPTVVDAVPGSEQLDRYETLKKKNADSPLFFIVKGRKL